MRALPVLPHAYKPCACCGADAGVKNSMKRRNGALAVSADKYRQRFKSGTDSAGGGTISSVSKIRALGIRLNTVHLSCNRPHHRCLSCWFRQQDTAEFS